MRSKDDIMAGVILTGLLSHLYAYACWDKYTKVNIYYITMYFLFYSLSLVVSFFAKSVFLKVVMSLMLSFSGYCVYLEFAGDPSNWTLAQQLAGLFIVLNGGMLVLIIEKVKK